MLIPERYDRYKGLIHPVKIEKTRVFVVGVGAIGYAVARMFAIMGVGQIVLVDPDNIEDVNLGTQGWPEEQVGIEKVDAAEEEINLLNPSVKVNTVFGKSHPFIGDDFKIGENSSVTEVLVLSVDSISDRRGIYTAMGNRFNLIIDPRMAAEIVRIFALNPQDSVQAAKYEKTFFEQDEAYRAPGCTQPSTYYTALISAGFVGAEYARFLRGVPPERDVLYNVYAFEQTKNAGV